MSSFSENDKPFEQQYSKSDYELVARENCFQGFFSLDKVELKFKRFDESWSQIISREIFIRGNATCVLPYDPVKDNVVLVEQFRPGVIFDDQNPWMLELIAGMNGEGEDPEGVARRESLEEANLTLGEIEKICEYMVSPGGTTEKVYLFCSKIDSSGVGGVYGLPEENEDIKVHVMSVDQSMELVQKGVINNAAAIIALQWLMMNKDRLRKRWA